MFTDGLPGVDVSVSELSMLAVTKRVDVSILHQDHCETTEPRLTLLSPFSYVISTYAMF